MANPRKRQRIPDDLADPSDGPSELRRDKEFWFNDGSIVLATGTTAFRVHSGVLALRSQVFRDMLAVGQSNVEGQELMDGCPVVHLSDKAEELYELLKVVYYPDSLRRGTDIKFPLILQLLWLSRKYDVEYIRKELVEHLRMLFPSTLEDFEDKWEELEPPFGDIDDELMALQAGIMYDIPEILPAVYYMCCQQPLAALLKGGVLNGMEKRIPADQLDKILLGRERLLRLKRKYFESTMDECIVHRPVLHCPDLTRTYLWLLSQDDGMAWVNDLSFLFPNNLLADLADVYGMFDICRKCLGEWKATEEEGRRKAWDELPDCFGLKDWDELTKGSETT